MPTLADLTSIERAALELKYDGPIPAWEAADVIAARGRPAYVHVPTAHECRKTISHADEMVRRDQVEIDRYTAEIAKAWESRETYPEGSVGDQHTQRINYLIGQRKGVTDHQDIWLAVRAEAEKSLQWAVFAEHQKSAKEYLAQKRAAKMPAQSVAAE